MKKIMLSMICLSLLAGCDNTTSPEVKKEQQSQKQAGTNDYIKKLVKERSAEEVLSDMSKRETNLNQIKKIDKNFFDYYYSYENNDLYMHMVYMSHNDKKQEYPMLLNYAEIKQTLENDIERAYDAPEIPPVKMPEKTASLIGASSGGSETSEPCVDDYKINVTFNKEESLLSDLFYVKDPVKFTEKYKGTVNECVDVKDYSNFRKMDYEVYIHNLVSVKQKQIKQSVFKGDIKVPEGYK